MLEYRHWKHGILDDRLTHHGVSFITYISQLCHCTVTSLTLRKSHYCPITTLHWRHNGRNSVSNYQHRDSLFNRLFRRRSKETSKFRVTGLCAGNSPGPVNSRHKWPVTRKMFSLMTSSWVEQASRAREMYPTNVQELIIQPQKYPLWGCCSRVFVQRSYQCAAMILLK